MKIFLGLLIGGLLGVGAGLYFIVNNNIKLGGRGNVYSCTLPLFSRPGVASSTVVTTGNNMVLPTSSIRDYLSIYNGGTDKVAFDFGSEADAGKGYILTPSSTLVISPCGDFYTKASVQATMDSGGGSATLKLFFKHVAE